jgi:hypothetical protein
MAFCQDCAEEVPVDVVENEENYVDNGCVMMIMMCLRMPKGLKPDSLWNAIWAVEFPFASYSVARKRCMCTDKPS